MYVLMLMFWVLFCCVAGLFSIFCKQFTTLLPCGGRRFLLTRSPSANFSVLQVSSFDQSSDLDGVMDCTHPHQGELWADMQACRSALRLRLLSVALARFQAKLLKFRSKTPVGRYDFVGANTRGVQLTEGVVLSWLADLTAEVHAGRVGGGEDTGTRNGIKVSRPALTPVPRSK